MKQPIAFGRFGALCPVAEFLGLPVKKVRRLRDMGLIRLPGGRTRPEDMSEDWKQYADQLIEKPPATPVVRRPGGDSRRRAVPPGQVPLLVGNHATWLAAQGGEVRRQP